MSESVGCTEVLRKKPGFWGPAIGFLVEGRSDFLVDGRSNLREMCDRI
ncbi:hypothetical protein [Microcoleus sp. B3-C5]